MKENKKAILEILKKSSKKDGKFENLVLSTQKIKPSDVTVTMYDGGITFHKGGFIAEAEYLYKHYSKDAFHDVHAFDGFVCYDIPVRNQKSIIRKVSPLARYGYCPGRMPAASVGRQAWHRKIRLRWRWL